MKKIIIGFAFLFYFIQFVHYNFSRGMRLDSVPIGIETILILSYILFYFYDYFKVSKSPIYSDSHFYLIIGIFIYLTATFFFNILINYLTEDELHRYWHYTYIPEIIKNILFAITIATYHHQRSDSHSLKNKNIPNLDMI